MPGGEAPACPAGELGAQIVSGLETQMLTSEGHALREEGLVGALISRAPAYKRLHCRTMACEVDHS